MHFLWLANRSLFFSINVTKKLTNNFCRRFRIVVLLIENTYEPMFAAFLFHMLQFSPFYIATYLSMDIGQDTYNNI